MAFSLYTVLFVAIFAASLHDCSALTEEKKAEIKEKLKPILSECGSQYEITSEILADFKAQKKHPDDSNKCFFACVFKKTGLMDDKGLFSEDGALKKISQYGEESKLEQATAAAKACNSVNEATVSDGEAGCDRAKLLFDCIVEQKELNGFSI